MEVAELPVRARSLPLIHHRNAALTFEARLRLIQRCQDRPIAHVGAEMGLSRATASTWVQQVSRRGRGRPERPFEPSWILPVSDPLGGRCPYRTPASGAEVVGAADLDQAHRHRRRDLTFDHRSLAGAAGAEPAPLARRRRDAVAQARQDHRALQGSYGPPGCEEGRSDPRWWGLAGPWPRQGRPTPEGRLHLPSHRDRRVEPTRVHRAFA